MAIIAKETGGQKFDPIPEGVYVAVPYSIVDIGEQFSERFNNSLRKVMITWELPQELIDVQGELKPRCISKEYTLSLSEKSNLRRELESWRGKKFNDEELLGWDLKNILGKGCQIQILHNDKGYANISAIMSLPKGTKIDPPINDIVYFDLEEENALEQIGKLPNWVQEKIRKSETYKRMTDVGVLGDGFCEVDEIDERPLPF